MHLRGLFSTRAIFTKGTCRPYLLSWGNPLSLPPPRGRQRMLSVQPTSPHRETAASNGPPEDLTLKHRRSLQARSRSSKSQVAILEPRLIERLHAHRPRTASHPYQLLGTLQLQSLRTTVREQTSTWSQPRCDMTTLPRTGRFFQRETDRPPTSGLAVMSR